MSAMRNRKSLGIPQFPSNSLTDDFQLLASGNESEVPALRVCHQEVAEHLYPGDRFELFWVDKIGIEGERVGLAEQLDQATVFLDQIVRQHGDAEPTLACAQDTKHIVHRQMRRARAFSV